MRDGARHNWVHSLSHRRGLGPWLVLVCCFFGAVLHAAEDDRKKLYNAFFLDGEKTTWILVVRPDRSYIVFTPDGQKVSGRAGYSGRELAIFLDKRRRHFSYKMDEGNDLQLKVHEKDQPDVDAPLKDMPPKPNVEKWLKWISSENWKARGHDIALPGGLSIAEALTVEAKKPPPLKKKPEPEKPPEPKAPDTPFETAAHPREVSGDYEGQTTDKRPYTIMFLKDGTFEYHSPLAKRTIGTYRYANGVLRLETGFHHRELALGETADGLGVWVARMTDDKLSTEDPLGKMRPQVKGHEFWKRPGRPWPAKIPPAKGQTVAQVEVEKPVNEPKPIDRPENVAQDLKPIDKPKPVAEKPVVKEVKKEPVVVADAGDEPKPLAEPDRKPDPKPEPEPEKPTPEPRPEPKQEPKKVAMAPESEPEPKPEPKRVAPPKTETAEWPTLPPLVEPKPEPKTEPEKVAEKSASEPAPQPDAKPEPAPVKVAENPSPAPKPEPIMESEKPAPKSEPQPTPKKVVEQPKPEPMPEPQKVVEKPAPKPEAKPEPKVEPKPEPEPKKVAEKPAPEKKPDEQTKPLPIKIVQEDYWSVEEGDLAPPAEQGASAAESSPARLVKNEPAAPKKPLAPPPVPIKAMDQIVGRYRYRPNPLVTETLILTANGKFAYNDTNGAIASGTVHLAEGVMTLKSGEVVRVFDVVRHEDGSVVLTRNGEDKPRILNDLASMSPSVKKSARFYKR